ncbi:MAG: hypothetical protein ACRDKJ_08475 [Actinomycetota bacterium]
MAAACVSSRSDQGQSPVPNRYGGNGAGAEPGDPQVDLGPRGGDGPSVRISGGPRDAEGSRTSATGVDDFARLGANTRLYLSSEIPKLVVEIDALEGYTPSPSAVGLLRSRLASVVDKPGGIEILPVETFTGGRESWNEEQLIAVQRQHRDRWSDRNAIVLYVLYVDGSFTDDATSLGVSFNASMYAMFAEQIRSAAATPLVSGEAIERAVLVHEMGHILALVNLGYDSPRDHEDPRHEGHSNNPDSVMYWAVDNVGVANLVGGRTSPPTQFDADDLADLEDLRRGRIRVD